MLDGIFSYRSIADNSKPHLMTQTTGRNNWEARISLIKRCTCVDIQGVTILNHALNVTLSPHIKYLETILTVYI